MKLPTATSLTMACIAVLASCARTPQFPDIPPHIVEDCRREAALLAEPPWLEPNDPMGSGQQTGDVIEDARTAESEAEGTGLTGWPREVLLYRCLAGRGATLTTEQARTLAEWERRLEHGRPE
jgi:hypothetical protein